MRYVIRLSYDGTSLSGWQVQASGRGTVQGALKGALRTLLHEDVGVTGAGRTDAGVNAIGYVAHFDLAAPLSMEAGQFCYKLNAITPPSIVIHSVEPADGDFHARFTACSREYTYFLHRKRDPFVAHYSYYLRIPLDVERMNRAAVYLLGTHDFSCFEKTGSDNVSSVCTLTEARWETYVPSHVSLLRYPAEEGDYLFFRVRANRFLRNMVRAIVGSLIEVGRGRQEPEWILTLLDGGGSRSDAGESVPGHALFLSGVDYPAASGEAPSVTSGEASSVIPSEAKESFL